MSISQTDGECTDWSKTKRKSYVSMPRRKMQLWRTSNKVDAVRINEKCHRNDLPSPRERSETGLRGQRSQHANSNLLADDTGKRSLFQVP